MLRPGKSTRTWTTRRTSGIASGRGYRSAQTLVLTRTSSRDHHVIMLLHRSRAPGRFAKNGRARSASSGSHLWRRGPAAAPPPKDLVSLADGLRDRAGVRDIRESDHPARPQGCLTRYRPRPPGNYVRASPSEVIYQTPPGAAPVPQSCGWGGRSLHRAPRPTVRSGGRPSLTLRHRRPQSESAVRGKRSCNDLRVYTSPPVWCRGE